MMEVIFTVNGIIALRWDGELEALKSLATRPDVTPEEMETALMKLVPTFKRYKPAKITIEEKI